MTIYGKTPVSRINDIDVLLQILDLDTGLPRSLKRGAAKLPAIVTIDCTLAWMDW